MSTPPLVTALLFIAGGETQPRPDSVDALILRLRDSEIRTELHPPDAVPPKATDDGPIVFVSIGNQPIDFQGLYRLPPQDRKRWLHFADAGEVKDDALFYCWLAATDPLPDAQELPASALSETPLVSVFTAA